MHTMIPVFELQSVSVPAQTWNSLDSPEARMPA